MWTCGVLHQLVFFYQAWYLVFGARDVLEQSGKHLHKKVEVSVTSTPALGINWQSLVSMVIQTMALNPLGSSQQHHLVGKINVKIGDGTDVKIGDGRLGMGPM